MVCEAGQASCTSSCSQQLLRCLPTPRGGGGDWPQPGPAIAFVNECLAVKSCWLPAKSLVHCLLQNKGIQVVHKIWEIKTTTKNKLRVQTKTKTKARIWCCVCRRSSSGNHGWNCPGWYWGSSPDWRGCPECCGLPPLTQTGTTLAAPACSLNSEC